jgi:hypothetical protein
MPDSEVVVALVYPDLLGTSGDRGNALALARRARARGLPVRVLEVVDGEPLPGAADVDRVGGSEDATQLLALEALRARPGPRGSSPAPRAWRSARASSCSGASSPAPTGTGCPAWACST